MSLIETRVNYLTLKSLEPVQKGIRILDSLLRKPNERANILLVAEPILDGFQRSSSNGRNLDVDNISNRIKTDKISLDREGGKQLMVSTDEFQKFVRFDLGDFDWNLGGGTNVLEGLRHFANLTVVLPVNREDPFYGLMNEPLKRLEEVGINIIRVNRENGNPIKLRINGGSVDIRPKGGVIGKELEDVFKTISDSSDKFNGLVVSDYGRGMFDSGEYLVDFVSRLKKNSPDLFVLIDPRKAFLNIPGGIIKPNLDEARALVGENLSSEMLAYRLLRMFSDLKGVLLTLEGKGTIYADRTGNTTKFPPGFFIRDDFLINPSGAGDILISSLALLEGKLDWDSALQTSLMLASYSTTLPGTSALTPGLMKEVKDLIENGMMEGNLNFSPLASHNLYREVMQEKGYVSMDDMKEIGIILKDIENSFDWNGFVYPDVEEFLRQAIAKVDNFYIWTKGEITTPSGKLGFQTWKARSVGLNYPLIGGVDKIQIFENEFDVSELNIEKLVFVDDNLDNLLSVSEVMKKKGVEASSLVLILIDRHDKNDFLDIPPEANIKTVKDLREIELPENSTLFCDLDHTLFRQGTLRMELAKYLCNN